MDELILIGAGGHARACIDVIEYSGEYKIAGIIEKELKELEQTYNYSVLGFDEDLEKMFERYKHALITIGQIKTPEIRMKLFSSLKEIGYKLPVIISPSAYVSKHSTISEGTIVMHGAVVNAGASIGANCIINNHSLVEHDVVIGDHCHVSTGAILNGEVKMGTGSFLGSGSIVHHSITIGESCIIGAGSIISNNVSNNQLIRE
jgi:sugar O-acyltransferase (sialic acid O-acetyltransferase NeuD family)